MGMQVTTFSAGNIAVKAVAPGEIYKEKRFPLPGDRAQPAQQTEASRPEQQRQVMDLERTTLQLERISHAFDRRLKFSIDSDSNDIIVKVIDNETDKVIKVLPPEELQRLHSNIRETLGFLFDERV